MSAALRAAERLEILEPNTVELVLSSSLDFQKKVLETSEHQTAIQQQIEKLTGIRAAISVRTVQMEKVSPVPESSGGVATSDSRNNSSTSNRVAVPENSRSAAVVVRHDVDSSQDAFVQDVVDVFGAVVDRVINAPVRRDED